MRRLSSNSRSPPAVSAMFMCCNIASWAVGGLMDRPPSRPIRAGVTEHGRLPAGHYFQLSKNTPTRRADRGSAGARMEEGVARDPIDILQRNALTSEWCPRPQVRPVRTTQARLPKLRPNSWSEKMFTNLATGNTC